MKVEVAVLGFPSLIVRTVSVDVKQHFKKKRKKHHRAQELYEDRGGRPGLPVLMVPTVSVDVRAILMFHKCEGQSHKTASTDHNF